MAKMKNMTWTETKTFLDQVSNDILEEFKLKVETHGPYGDVINNYDEAAAELDAYDFVDAKLTDETHFEDFDRLTNQVVLREFSGEISSILSIRKVATRIIEKYDIEIPSKGFETFCTQVAEMLMKLHQDRDKYIGSLALSYGVNEEHLTKLMESRTGMDILVNAQAGCIPPESFSQDELPSSPTITETPVSSSQPTSISFGDLIERFVQYKQDRNEWNSSRTSEGNRKKLYLVNELLEGIKDKSDIRLNELTSDDVTSLEKWLRLLPSNSRKKFPTTPLKDLIAKSQKGKIAKDELISVVTYNGYAHLLMSMFEYASSARCRFVTENYFVNMTVKETDDNKRPPFENDDLHKFFNTDLFTQKDFRLKHSWRFWVPILMLYSGARVEEICQLRLSNIVKESNIHCLDIKNEEDPETGTTLTRVKNQSSQRIIPIHPKVKKIGFLKYIQLLKRKGEVKVFPTLSNVKKNGQHKQAGANVSKFFNEDSKQRYKKSYISQCGINEEGKPRKVLYCFRHTVETLIDNLRKEVHFEKIDRLLGHKVRSTGRDTYGGYSASTLLEIVKKIEYPKVEFPWDKNPDYKDIKFPWQT